MEPSIKKAPLDHNIMVMIPTYNEHENVEGLIHQILELPINVQIMIVDDNSPDGTGELAELLASQDSRVHIVHRYDERGRASAGLAGFRAALRCEPIDLIIEMDADFSHDPRDIPRLVEQSDKFDVVIGSRYVPHGQSLNCSLRNVLFSKIINRVDRALFHIPVRDASGGFKCYRRHVLETINLDDYLAREYAVGLETLVKCRTHGFSMVEIPIVFRNRVLGHSKADIHVLIEYPLTLLRLKLKSLKGQIK
jgi:dolichol-phosphate mannosyltransferase